MSDLEEEIKCITLRRSTFIGIIVVIVVLLLLVGGGGILGYSLLASPLAICTHVLTYHIGDQDALDGCSYKLAKEYKDIEYCNTIANNNLQKECVKVIENSRV